MYSLDDLTRLSTDLMSGQEKSAEKLRFCMISASGDFFAVDIRDIQEVFELETMTPVPGMPASLVGIANLRGTIVPLVDLRAILGLSLVVSPKYVVVVRHRGHHIGIVIDEVPETRSIDPNDLIVPSVQANPFFGSFIKIGSRLCGALEISRLVASVEGSINDMRPREGTGNEAHGADTRSGLLSGEEERYGEDR
jgi:purine-binding chemotaxis protein CheW